MEIKKTYIKPQTDVVCVIETENLLSASGGKTMSAYDMDATEQFNDGTVGYGKGHNSLWDFDEEED